LRARRESVEHDVVRSWLFIALIVGCYSAHPQAGAQCASDGSCPPGLVCSQATNTCETSNTTLPADAPLSYDGCIPSPEICGDGIDQDCDGIDPPCPTNDTASGAIDVTMGGTFTADVEYAHDDASGSGMFCGGSGGRDVFYKVKLMAAETYYFDTFDSDFDTIIRVYHGNCVDGGAPSNTTCRDNSCSTMQTQGIFTLGFGTSCIEVDQQSSAVTAGSLTLHVERGHRDGTGGITPGKSVLGDTSSNDDDQSTAVPSLTCSDEPAPDDDYYFALCPGSDATLAATTCGSASGSGSAFVSEVYIVGPTGQLACAECDPAADTGAATASAEVVGPHMYWIVVDGVASGADGAYQLDTTIQ
jgi:hypothetical protein